MKQKEFLGVVMLLASLCLTALPQIKPKAGASRSAKPVTVTLVRWPYT